MCRINSKHSCNKHVILISLLIKIWQFLVICIFTHGSVQDCSILSALAMEILQPLTNLSIYTLRITTFRICALKRCMHDNNDNRFYSFDYLLISLYCRIYASMNQVRIGSDNGLSPHSAPSHYLNQCWVLINWTLRNNHQWNFNQNTKLFIHKNVSENIVCEMVAKLLKVLSLTWYMYMSIFVFNSVLWVQTCVLWEAPT